MSCSAQGLVALRGSGNFVPLLPGLEQLLISSANDTKKSSTKKERSGGVGASTTVRIACAVATGSPWGVPDEEGTDPVH